MPVQPPRSGSVTATPGSPRHTRRVPSQRRSRERVERILDAAATLVVRNGVDAMTTQEIARSAGVPVASLYQYFGDKEDVLIALAGRDMAEMDDEVTTALLELGTDGLSVELVVRTTMEAFVRVYHRRRSFVEIYLRGRTNSAVHRFGRDHNRRIAVTPMSSPERAETLPAVPTRSPSCASRRAASATCSRSAVVTARTSRGSR